MGVQSVDLLRALRDRPRSTAPVLATRLRCDEREIKRLLLACRLANVAVCSHSKWSLTRAGRQLLELHDRARDQPGLDSMMHQNRGLIPA